MSKKHRLVLSVFLYTHCVCMDVNTITITPPSETQTQNIPEKTPAKNHASTCSYTSYDLTKGAIKGAKYGLITGSLVGGCTTIVYLILNQINISNAYTVVLGSMLGGTTLGAVSGTLIGMPLAIACCSSSH